MKGKLSQLAVPLGIVGIILLLVVPVPAPLLDVLIVTNILLALLILLTSIFTQKPLDFSVFPSVLLVATMFRLGLNVASTRLVLGEAHAGQVIEAFGQVAVGGSLIIGIVVFLILVVIQFVVVTKGAERVAEVGARFTLDAMPGKQMAIDADLNAGLITDVQARERRAEVSAEADFYGAMDGASKFVKGDAIAGLVITIVNLVGGVAIGMIQNGLGIGEALNTYALLTIGDGLVTQIPALLMAVATGMIVTRSAAEEDMASSASRQLTQSSRALYIAAGAAVVMGLIPGMPVLVFLGAAVLLVVLARSVTRRDAAEARGAETAAAEAAAGPAPDPARELMEQMRVPALEVLLATDLVGLVTGAGDDLLGRVKSLRRKMALETGMVIPPVRTRDSVELAPGTYSIRVAGVEAASGTLPAGMLLALGGNLATLPGTATVDPVFGLDGKWVPTELRYSAELAGCTVIDRVSVLMTHLSDVVSRNAARLLSREDVRALNEALKEESPSAVEELVPGLLSLAEVQRVLQGLLAEQVPINDLARIYEALTLRARTSTDPEPLVEAARTGLGPAVVAPYVREGVLTVITFEPRAEQLMLEGMRPSDAGTQILLEPQRLDALTQSLKAALDRAAAADRRPVLVCAPALRPAVRRLVLPHADLPVLNYQEATATAARIDTVGVVNLADAITV
ncbi:flagellar biosynthesis protein FlhA [Zafaria cholistanensis]|uniref:Flagellar biosynthesis protein FlhA n=1 Tax=Zafaria cholistanensis TaxID=1682741 RepID=A0A5A7NNP2_9MICC|nr:flagellar biosynthesis protein FlhA [Zafaria cholistanensis]GER21667.1 flagellar biosynthesis protein FlhA [Zafaria cholistanensis]